VAEVLVHLGEPEEARRIYARLVAHTGHPQFMDALARLELARGDRTAAARWIASARQSWMERLARFPEAAAGHALDHFLELEEDPATALAMAERNFELRPDGEAGFQLARALRKSGRDREALAAVERVLGSGWRRAELHALAAELYGSAGETERARLELERARAVNPQVSVEPRIAARPGSSLP
jgi:tetratricopeptide (TPR) repeat protein